MIKPRRFRSGVTTSLLAALALAVPALSYADGAGRERSYSVTVTNITKAVQFTPILAASHTRAIAFFDLGEAAIAPLADIAESGNIDALKAVLDESEAVFGVANTEGLLEAGHSVTFEITANRRTRGFSMAAMLLPTNDSFVALNTVGLPYYGSATYYAHAYDSGTEPNDESCAHIPGPTCGGEGRSPDDDNAEGFVHISNGVHNMGDLNAEKYDWRGPVAEVIITRLR